MGRELTMGLDIGTTSAKAVLFDLQGKLIAEAEQMITSYYPYPSWVEQDPDEIEQAAVLAVKEAVEKAGIKNGELLGIGFSSAMHSLICTDSDGQPLSRMLTWADGRSSGQAEELMKANGKDIYLRTGTPIHPMSPFIKLLWMKETDYQPYRDASYFISMKEFLLYKWFGKRLIDYSMASATGMLNVDTLDWDAEVLEMTGVRKEQLSRIVAPTEVLAGIEESTAKRMGLPDEVPFVIGAADGQLANLGDGAISPGEAAVSAGTSGAIRQFAKGIRVNDEQETFSYAFTAASSIIGGPTNNGGIALQWLKDLMEFKGSHDEFIKGAAEVAPGAEGVIFLPYINGERAPLWNQQAKGNFYGLNIVHKKDHLVRAVLEGITFNIYQISQSLAKVAGEPETICVNGGLARSPVWTQIMADIFGKEINLSESHHSAAWGAAWTALVGLGKAESFEAIKQYGKKGKVVKPNQENHRKYMEVYEKYASLSKDLSAYFS